MRKHQPDADQDADRDGNVAASKLPAALLSCPASRSTLVGERKIMRKQKGYVFRAGDFWFIRYRDSRSHAGEVTRQQMAVKLCPVSLEHRRCKVPPATVLAERDRFMEKINHSTVAPEHLLTMGDFVTQVWNPFLESHRAASTRHHYGYYWKHILDPRCGSELLRDFSTVAGQPCSTSSHGTIPPCARPPCDGSRARCRAS